MPSIEALDALLRKNLISIDTSSANEERWISWEEWRWTKVNELLDKAAKKRGKRRKPDAWQSWTAAHLQRLQASTIGRYEGLADDGSGSDRDSSWSATRRAS